MPIAQKGVQGFLPGGSQFPRKAINGFHKKQIMAWIDKFVKNHQKTVEEDFKNVSPKDRLKFYEAILSFAAPKLSGIDLTSLGESIAPDNSTLKKYTAEELAQMREIAKKAEGRNAK